MAFSHTRLVNNGLATPSYNFDRKVTTFGGGSKVDVMLLQALFRIAFYEFPAGTDGTKLIKPAISNGIIVVDGIVGEQTRAHIDAFQAQLKKMGGNVIPDGVIDPYPKINARTLHTKEKFQLDFLNIFCSNVAVDAGKRDAYRRMIDLDMHSEEDWGIRAEPLRQALRTPRKFP